MTVLPYLIDHYYDDNMDNVSTQYFTEHELNGNKYCSYAKNFSRFFLCKLQSETTSGSVFIFSYEQPTKY